MVARFKGERGKRKVGRTCTPNPKAFLGFPIADFHLHPIGQNRAREEDGERLDKPVNSFLYHRVGLFDSRFLSS